MAMMSLLLTIGRACKGSKQSEFNIATKKLINVMTLLLEEALLVHKILFYINAPQLTLLCWLVLMLLELCMSAFALMFLFLS